MEALGEREMKKITVRKQEHYKTTSKTNMSRMKQTPLGM